ncbi:NFX1-type zinc finger protein [Rhizoctonia solani 123E]|uniref:NFX1-type zinc finger protein n=1 Tax=Rhizoctonia solani 123E TaxID=1423351 RepID=A0A074RVE1_9AGAM|nr:NFX1-type zinc finger protein [Rhizoctonia solani 123E]
MVSKPICRFHQSPGGCRQGTNCKFAHTGTPGASTNASGSGSNSNPTQPPLDPNVPAGICRFFWSRGSCNRGSSCTYVHQRPDSQGNPPAPPVQVPYGVCRAYWTSGLCGRGAACKFQHRDNPAATPPEEKSPNSLQLHFKAAGLGHFAALDIDKFCAGTGKGASPSETKSFLRRFLQDNFRFQTATQVYTFLEMICNANTQNTEWRLEDGQEHLHLLAKPDGNGILRIGDAIRFPQEESNLNGGTTWSFQRGYLPLLTYLSSEWVIKSTLHHDINILYGLIHTNFEPFHKTIQESMTKLMQARSFQESGRPPLSGSHIFKVLFTTISEYLIRFKDAPRTNPAVNELVQRVVGWFDDWSSSVATPSGFQDEITSYSDEVRTFLIKNLSSGKKHVLSLIERDKIRIVDPTKRIVPTGPMSTEALLANLQRIREHDGPGELRVKGPRHDNDHLLIENIRIAPTHQELMCEIAPYLPPNFPGAPHFFEETNAQRLLDIQFRLLREELIAPIRMAIQLIVSDLNSPPETETETRLSQIIKANGGRYSAQTNNQDSVIFSVFTNVSFEGGANAEPLELNNRGSSVGIQFDAPPGKARSKQAATREAYWEQVSKKRLMQGGLVALIWQGISGELDIYIGTVASHPGALKESSRKSEDRVSLRVSFFDTAAELRIIRALQTRGYNGSQLLIEAPVFFEGIRPFLEALQNNRGLLPFSQHLCHRSEEEIRNTVVSPPSYALTPGFAFELKDLFPSDANVQTLALRPNDTISTEWAKGELSKSSRLDPSQADAVVDSLTREVCLIQGPPGTGKSYTGLEIIRVLIKNKVSPILLVAFTNHALDHMLKGVLDAKITNNIIRLGSKHAADERIMEFSLENAEKLQSQAEQKDRMIGAAYKEMKISQNDMKELMKKLALRDVSQDHFEKYLLVDYPLHYEELFTSPPEWIYSLALQAAEDEAGWTTVGGNPQDFSMLRFWLTARDLEFLRPPPAPKASKNKGKKKSKGKAANHNPYEVLSEQAEVVDQTGDFEEDDIVVKHREFVIQFLYQHGIEATPSIPETDRPVEELISNPRVWEMSLKEREALYNTWYMVASDSIRESQVEDFERLQRIHAVALKKYQEIQDQNRVNLLRKAHIVGCTTTGAAKVVSLLSGMSPKVMIVEEAGQVLESHILASLVPSVEQIIMIGDPLQLRPSINNYKLSIENRETGSIYRFDQSLMERLHKSGFPMSQLNVQRRMRPAISSLIRNTLYPKLEDHELVKHYPDVRGMHKNVFFLSHAHKEVGGGEDAVSKYNQYELDMIYDLVLHLLKQGCYNSSKNIVVLSAYLGQIPKIRKKLQNVVTTVVDERDAELLEQLGLDDEDSTPVQLVQASSRVLIRTLDNFQGEEGEIIILSLVRNSGTAFDGDATSLQYVPGTRSRIGFLKSDNRTNVGLSRAKHGLYIFGNAPELARSSRMWATVLRELHANDSIGTALPISCYQHPNYVEKVDQPGRLEVVSPDGGCLRPCNAPLGCGHRCPHKCHANDPNHISTKCYERCLRLCSAASHPCNRKCHECVKGCGDCMFPVSNVLLPCGHTHPSAPCHLAQVKEKIKCKFVVRKELPSCEHTAYMPCYQDPATYKCQEQCGVGYACCSKSCNARCGDCQALNTAQENQAQIPRVLHPPHPCGRRLFCGHECKDNCEVGHQCSGSCNDSCRQICPHNVCEKPCSVPCNPCVKKCSWICAHSTCPATCGMACTRLPCDKKCPNTLKCGHPCPSVCGEPCANQVCRVCASEDQLDAVVDMIMQLTLRDVDNSDSLDAMTITLKCGHTFTVETLDGITHLGDFYAQNSEGKWVQAVTPETHGENRVRPVCPTCRGDIDALRYGRVCKSSNLAILQHNISSKLSKLLRVAQTTLGEAFIGLEPAIVLAADKCPPYEPPSLPEVVKANEALEILLRKQPELPTPSKTLEGLHEFHGLPSAYTKLWKGVVKKLLQAYRQAQQVTTHRDSTVQTYEASLATLFEEELEYFAAHPTPTSQNIEQRALQLARMRIGQPPPRASLRFTVEAFWVTIRVLISLAETANHASKTIRNRGPDSIQNCTPWSNLAEYFLRRAVHDSRTALNLAERSESWNKAAKCQVIAMQAQFELVSHQCRTTIELGRLTAATKVDLMRMCAEEFEAAQELRMKVAREYVDRAANDSRSRMQWIEDNFLKPTVQILDSWKELKQTVESGVWYSTLTKEESRDIMRALMAGSHTGHFYECVNGHPYVIGECGGAMQRSTCPECGAGIGGSNHAIDSGNRHARQFVEMAREEGVQASPWAWGPGRG